MEGVITIDELYELYLSIASDKIYKKSDIISLLISKEYRIIHSNEHNDQLCLFYYE